MNARDPNLPLRADEAEGLATFAARTWDEEIVPALTDYIRVPAKSPHFDGDWEAHGHIERVIVAAHGLLSMEPPHLSKWGRLKPLLRLTEWPFTYLSNARTSVSRPDAEYLEATYQRPVTYLPNGVDELKPDLPAARGLLGRRGLEQGN